MSNNPKNAKKIDSGYEKFIKAANTKLDTATMLLRFHLLSEYYLEQIINHYLKRGDFITSQKFTFTYFNKLIIVKSFDILPDNLISSLEKLNSVRNKCSHEMEYEISESDIDYIGTPFNTDYYKLKKEHKNLKELTHWLFGYMSANLSGHLDMIDYKNESNVTTAVSANHKDNNSVEKPPLEKS